MALTIEKNRISEQGFSLIEILIVLLVISILSVLTLMAFKGEKKFLADTEAYQILDIFNEARQRALTQHETMRVEINKTKNTIRLITENSPGTASDDQIVKTLTLQHPNYVAFEVAPTNMTASPVDSSPTPAITFSPSVHPLSTSNQIATLRFTRTGKVLNAGSNSVGNNAVVTGATIYVWMPNYSSAGIAQKTGSVLRAITVLGTTGATKYWRCGLVNGNCSEWIQ